MKTPPDVESSIVRQYLAADRTIRAIAETHGVDPATVHRIINRHKVQRRTDSKWLPTWSDVIDARTSIASSGEDPTTERVALYLGCSRTAIQRLQAANGGVIFDGVEPQEVAEIVAGYQNLSIRALAGKYHRNVSTISAILVTHGVTLRNRGRRPQVPPPPL